MRRKLQVKGNPCQATHREADRKRKYRRALDLEILETRVPASEQIGGGLAISALAQAGSLAGRLASPAIVEQVQPVRVMVQQPSVNQKVSVLSSDSSPINPGQLASGAQEVGNKATQTQSRIGELLKGWPNDNLSSQPFDDLTREFFNLLGSSVRQREGNMARMGSMSQSGAVTGREDPLLNQAASAGAGTALGGGLGSSSAAAAPVADLSGTGSPVLASSLPTASAASFLSPPASLASGDSSTAANGTGTVAVADQPPPPPDGGGGKKKKE